MKLIIIYKTTQIFLGQSQLHLSMIKPVIFHKITFKIVKIPNKLLLIPMNLIAKKYVDKYFKLSHNNLIKILLIDNK